MGIKSWRNRHTEIRNTINTVLGVNARTRYDTFAAKHLTGNKKHPAKEMHAGKGCSPTKAQRDAIRALMMVGYMTSKDITFAIQLKELHRNDTVLVIQGVMADIWQEYQTLKNIQKDVGLVAKMNHFFAHPLEFTKRYSILAMGEMQCGAEYHLATINTFPDNYKGANNDGVIPVVMKAASLVMGFGTRLTYENGSNSECYFLGWSSNRLTQLTIPNMAVNTPNVFFTASLSGCSVFVSGPQNAPSVYHFGSSGVNDRIRNQGHLQQRTKNAYNIGRDHRDRLWREAFLDLTAPNVARTQDVHTTTAMAAVGEVNRHHYLGTRRLQDFERRMRRKYKRNFGSCGGGGTVFGVRNNNNGNWTFYLQQNVVATYTNSNRQAIRHTLPLCIEQIFPLPRAVVYDGGGRKLPDVLTDNNIFC